MDCAALLCASRPRNPGKLLSEALSWNFPPRTLLIGQTAPAPPLKLELLFFPRLGAGFPLSGPPHLLQQSSRARTELAPLVSKFTYCVADLELKVFMEFVVEILLIQVGYHHEKSVLDRNRPRLHCRCNHSSSWRVQSEPSGF